MQPSATQIAREIGVRSLRMAEFDFEDIKNRAAKTVGRMGCATSNVIVVDEAGFRGWRLKARCSGGTTLMVKIDLNGEVSEVDVLE